MTNINIGMNAKVYKKVLRTRREEFTRVRTIHASCILLIFPVTLSFILLYPWTRTYTFLISHFIVAVPLLIL